LAVSATSTLTVPSTEAWFFEGFNQALVSLSLDDLVNAF
jgi:hypothetical protein